MNRSFSALTLLALATLASSAGAQIDAVSVSGGRIQGVRAKDITSFKGIPFAESPVGANRWRSPQPVKSWSGVKKADSFAPACVQDPSLARLFGAPEQFNEDCLYLNVWTPAAIASDRLPVMVWIHGGGFTQGSTAFPTESEGAARLAEQGVVVVSLAYRLGQLGFLAHPELSQETGHGSGNFGFEDQIAGLEWVRDNIAQFGGDPGRVTIFGGSAGAMSVNVLTASPKARGLFHGAIAQSGSQFGPGWPLSLKEAEVTGSAFLASLGAHDIKTARALSVEAIQSATKPNLHMGGARSATTSNLDLAGTLDGYVIVGNLQDLYGSGRFNDTPVILGTNSDEGLAFVPPFTLRQDLINWARARYGPNADVILEAYPDDAQVLLAARGIFRDGTYAWPTWNWVRAQSAHNGRAFLYYFDVPTAATPGGSPHGDEIGYVFRNLPSGPRSLPLPPPTQAQVALSELVSRYWVNFAKTGDPNGAGLPPWPAFSERAPNTMHFDESPEARKDVPNQDKLEAWERYFSTRQ